MVGPNKQAFCPKINMLKGNFDTNYFEPLNYDFQPYILSLLLGKKKIQKPKRCRQLPQHLIHTVFQIFHTENRDNQPLLLELLKIISGST